MQSILKNLSDNLNGEIVTYPYDRVYQFNGMPKMIIEEDSKSWALDLVINKYLKTHPKTPVIANLGTVNIWNKHTTKIINIFNDPYMKAQDVLRKYSKFCYMDGLVQRMTELQIRASKGAINVAISKVTKDAMKDLGIKCDKVIEHGVDDKIFRPFDKDLRKKYNIPLGKRIGLFVGITHHVKNWEVMKKLMERKDIVWILALKTKIPKANNPIGKCVFYGSNREQMVEFYNLADFVIIPSFFESFGLVSVEAGMCGTPVVSSKVGWIQEKGLTDYGIVVDSFKYEDFNRAIDELPNHDFTPRKYMQKRFDFNKWIDKWKRLTTESE